MILQIVTLLLVYGLILFLLIVIEHVAIRSAESLTTWLTGKRIAISAAIAFVLVGSGLAVALKLEWIKFGTPADHPGYEDKLPEGPIATPDAGKAPKIRKVVKSGSMDSTQKDHKKRLDDFEKQKK